MNTVNVPPFCDKCNGTGFVARARVVRPLQNEPQPTRKHTDKAWTDAVDTSREAVLDQIHPIDCPICNGTGHTN